MLRFGKGQIVVENRLLNNFIKSLIFVSVNEVILLNFILDRHRKTEVSSGKKVCITSTASQMHLLFQ
jgi:hypothetical protein